MQALLHLLAAEKRLHGILCLYLLMIHPPPIRLLEQWIEEEATSCSLVCIDKEC